MTRILLVALAVAVFLLALRSHRRARRRRAEADRVASELVPEIRAILRSSDSGAEPVPAPVYQESRGGLPQLFGREVQFAVETFYQTVDAYREASQAMQEAFAEGSEASLGDRIRAKDRRDRSLKDVFYAGEAAIERLSKGTG